MSPKDLVLKWVDAFNNQDVNAIIGLYHKNAINHQVAKTAVEGVQAIREMFSEEFSGKKMVCIIENLFEDGDWAILEWIDPRGLRGCGFFHIINNKIILQRGYWDKLTSMRLKSLE